MLYYVGMNYLIDTGRWSGRIRKHLRAFLASQPNQNAYINDLIQKDYDRALKKPPKPIKPKA